MRRELLAGRGFHLFRGIPVERYTARQSAIAFWALGLHLGEPVSQNGKGHVLGHVTNLGLNYADHAAEAGADYVGFGPAGATGLGDGSVAPHELFAWWSEMIEIPVVAEGGITPEVAFGLAGAADFLALRDALW